MLEVLLTLDDDKTIAFCRQVQKSAKRDIDVIVCSTIAELAREVVTQKARKGGYKVYSDRVSVILGNKWDCTAVKSRLLNAGADIRCLWNVMLA